jgi:hypothetical protein
MTDNNFAKAGWWVQSKWLRDSKGLIQRSREEGGSASTPPSRSSLLEGSASMQKERKLVLGKTPCDFEVEVGLSKKKIFCLAILAQHYS